MTTPIVFLSHSSKDKELSTNLATDLRKNGIDAWFDKWEILPGDSFRRKIDEGIGQATHFIVLLTVNSLKSEWVQTEIDAAMVLKIEGQCRLIPVLYEIDFKDIPPTLRGLSSVDISDYNMGLQLLIDTCYELSRKPPLGKTPIQPPFAGLSLSPNAQRIATLLCKRSETGISNDPILPIDEIEKELSIPLSTIEEGADELKDEGLVKVMHLINAPVRIFPTNALFWVADIINGWDSHKDAQTIASALINKGEQGLRLAELTDLLNWQPRRINPAATFLVDNEISEASKATGSHPYAYHWLRANTKTRRFVKNSE